MHTLAELLASFLIIMKCAKNFHRVSYDGFFSNLCHLHWVLAMFRFTSMKCHSNGTAAKYNSVFTKWTCHMFSIRESVEFPMWGWPGCGPAPFRPQKTVPSSLSRGCYAINTSELYRTSGKLSTTVTYCFSEHKAASEF